MLFEYLTELKKCLPKEKFEDVLKMVEEVIKFNKVGFNKTTTGLEFAKLCEWCLVCLKRC